jgi:hypothetical protein
MAPRLKQCDAFAVVGSAREMQRRPGALFHSTGDEVYSGVALMLIRRGPT